MWATLFGAASAWLAWQFFVAYRPPARQRRRPNLIGGAGLSRRVAFRRVRSQPRALAGKDGARDPLGKLSRTTRRLPAGAIAGKQSRRDRSRSRPGSTRLSLVERKPDGSSGSGTQMRTPVATAEGPRLVHTPIRKYGASLWLEATLRSISTTRAGTGVALADIQIAVVLPQVRLIRRIDEEARIRLERAVVAQQPGRPAQKEPGGMGLRRKASSRPVERGWEFSVARHSWAGPGSATNSARPVAVS